MLGLASAVQGHKDQRRVATSKILFDASLRTDLLIKILLRCFAAVLMVGRTPVLVCIQPASLAFDLCRNGKAGHKRAGQTS